LRNGVIVLLGIGGYLPSRVVTNELVQQFPEIMPICLHQVTGIPRAPRWAADDEKPSDMAYRAALEAIRRSDIDAKDIDAVIVATTTPDVAMPSTAAILQDRLNLQTIPAFDLNAACSGWLYAVPWPRDDPPVRPITLTVGSAYRDC
jgi:3-oxoacyl-[acyl-carrier-protein] synthase-3